MKKVCLVLCLFSFPLFVWGEEDKVLSESNSGIENAESAVQEAAVADKEAEKVPWEHLSPSLFGAGYGNFIDSSVSPLMKEGYSLGTYGSDYFKKNNWIIDLQFSSSVGYMYQNYSISSDLIPFMFNVSAEFLPLVLYRIASVSPGSTDWDFYLGAGPDIFWVGDFHMMTNVSNFMNFDASLKLAFESELDFTLGRKNPKDFTFHFGVNSTVVSWFNNYPYAPQAVFEGDDLLSGYFGNMAWGSIDKVWRGTGKAGLTMHYKNGNAFDISYIYHLHNYWKPDYSVQGGSGMLFFGYLMRMDNTKIGSEVK